MPDTTTPPKPVKKVNIEPTCENCNWADAINGTPFVHCTVDLPPSVLRSNDSRKHSTHKTYSCGLWRGKKLT